MSGQDNNTGEKTEKATPKKIRDARKEGNVAKSKDLTQTITLFVWALLLMGLGGMYMERLTVLLDFTWVRVSDVNKQTIYELGIAATKVLLTLLIIPLLLVSIVGVIVEYFQVGAVLAFKKISPKASYLNPTNGFKRVFSMDNLIEIIKSMLKTVIIASIVAIIFLGYLNDSIKLVFSDLSHYALLEKRMIFLLCVWVVAVFSFLTILDWFYQKFSHAKKLRMSKYDVKKEYKQSDGDPHIKGKRRQLHKQWATQNTRQATKKASAVVVNPTHISIALYYQPDETELPMILAKGEGSQAQLIRETALDHGIPIFRNIPLARVLNDIGEEDDYVPEDYFVAVAQVLAWADYVKRSQLMSEKQSLFRDTGHDPLL